MRIIATKAFCARRAVLHHLRQKSRHLHGSRKANFESKALQSNDMHAEHTICADQAESQPAYDPAR